MNQSLVSILTLVFILENGKIVETVAGEVMDFQQMVLV
jgi:hypothetical protein